MVEPAGGFGEGLNYGVNPLFHRVAFAVARMGDQVFGADQKSTFDFAPEGGGGLRA